MPAWFAGAFGLLRAIVTAPRLAVAPAATLAYAIAVTALIRFGAEARLMAMGLGMIYTAALFLPVVGLFRNHFGKSSPAWLCSQCDYPLFNLTEPICPECGKPFDPNKVPAITQDHHANR